MIRLFRAWRMKRIMNKRFKNWMRFTDLKKTWKHDTITINFELVKEEK